MILLKPDYLLFMLIPALILFFFILLHKNTITTIFDQKILEKLTFDNGSLGRMGRNFMLFTALFLIIFALSRPVVEKGDVTIKNRSIDIMVALDISKSMLASDIYPNRLEFAKQKLYKFIDSFEEANIGVVAFSSEGFLVSPMTRDSTTLKYLIKNLSLDSLSTSGTNLMIPINKAKSFLKESKQKIMIIVTDGGDSTTFEKEIAAAKEEDIHIYIYATATNQGAPIQEDGASIKDKTGNIVITKLNSAIKTLAIESGGAYIVGGLRDQSIQILVEDIKKKFELQEKESREVKEYQELFYYPLALALLFILFAFSSLPKRNSTTILLLLFLIPHVHLKAGIFDFQTIQKANEAYQNQAYKEAIESYTEVAKSKQNAQSFYDLANALYKDKQYESALKQYQSITTKDQNLEYKKRFNIGNSYFQMQKYEEALKAYEDAKKIQSEEDLTHNIELTKKQIKKEQQKQQNKEQQNQKKDKDKEQQQNNQQKPDKEQKEKQQDKGDQKESKSADQQEKSEQAQQAQKKEEEKISEKEAKKWEEQLEKMKPKTMPMQFQSNSVERSKNENPW
ncbi:MAG: VWA domain-containing protein [Epsilonproteobacteria bacterium]|nr:VWA domain-containing protein [Campylobacterota bacterium]